MMFVTEWNRLVKRVYLVYETNAVDVEKNSRTLASARPLLALNWHCVEIFEPSDLLVSCLFGELRITHILCCVKQGRKIYSRLPNQIYARFSCCQQFSDQKISSWNCLVGQTCVCLYILLFIEPYIVYLHALTFAITSFIVCLMSELKLLVLGRFFLKNCMAQSGL